LELINHFGYFWLIILLKNILPIEKYVFISIQIGEKP